MGFPFELFEQEFWKLFLHVHAYMYALWKTKSYFGTQLIGRSSDKYVQGHKFKSY